MPTIEGDNFDNSLPGTNQPDLIFGYAGDDFIYGEGGDDVVFGGDDDDLIEGGDGSDDLYGEDGDDDIEGGDGNDDLFGGAGNDTLADWGNGTNRMRGGTGDDTYLYVSVGDIVIEAAGQGYDTVEIHFPTFTSYTMTAHIERIVVWNGGFRANGNAQNNLMDSFGLDNTFFGMGGADRLNGDEGTNVLDGGDGNDVLDGQDGSDTLRGGFGLDTLRGGAGDDRVAGGSQADQQWGGAGFDTFVFSIPEHSNTANRDRILDFEFDRTRVFDKIDVTAIDANAVQPGNQAFVWTAGPGGIGTMWAENSPNNADTLIKANVNGTPGAEFVLAVADGARDQAIWDSGAYVLL